MRMSCHVPYCVVESNLNVDSKKRKKGSKREFSVKDSKSRKKGSKKKVYPIINVLILVLILHITSSHNLLKSY